MPSDAAFGLLDAPGARMNFQLDLIMCYNAAGGVAAMVMELKPGDL